LLRIYTNFELFFKWKTRWTGLVVLRTGCWVAVYGPWWQCEKVERLTWELTAQYYVAQNPVVAV
jgi:hypothetical protein